MNFLFWKTPKIGILPPLINLRKESWLLMECVYFLYLNGIIIMTTNFGTTTVEPLSNGHFGTNIINSSGLSPV